MGCTVQPRFGITRREGDASRLCASMIVFLASALAHGRRRSIGKDHGARLWAAQERITCCLRAERGKGMALMDGERYGTSRWPSGAAGDKDFLRGCLRAPKGAHRFNISFDRQCFFLGQYIVK